MPGRLSGLNLGRLLRRRHKLVPIIYMMGRPDPLAALTSPGPWEAVLSKPFSLSALHVLIRRLLGPRAPPLPRGVVSEA